jgi:ubiquinone biosynthesis protein
LKLFRITKTYKSARRLQQIINVFIRHGFGRIIDQIHLGKYIPFRNRLRAFGHWPAVKEPTIPERLRMAFAELGPSFIKLAQILSSRPDLITKVYAEEFRKLQDEVPPFPAAEAVGIIEEELRKPVSEVFLGFEDSPMAAASIAQVHKAALLDGQDVIVKVQRPDIKENILSDIDIMGTVSQLMEKHVPESRFFNPAGIVAEFSRTVQRELDFRGEARNCLRMRRIFRENPKVYIPEVYTDYLTEKVLVMERVKGVRVDEVEAIDRMGLDRGELASTITDAYLKMILEDGFFHADPHPGNIFVMEDGRVCFMDFGIVGWVTEETKATLASTFVSLLKKDYDGLVENYVELGYLPEDADVDTFRREFKADLVDLIEPLYGVAIKEINVAEYLDLVIQLAAKHRLIVPSDLLLINKTFMLLENILRELEPEFNFIDAAEPYAEKIAKEKYSPKKAIERVSKELADFGDTLVLFPRQFRQILRKFIRDEIRIKIVPLGLDNFIKDMDRSTNRIAFAMVVSSIIISSAIMHATGVGPMVYGFSSLGIITFVGAFFLGLWLLISIIRSGRM